jgi:hypothetical protein
MEILTGLLRTAARSRSRTAAAMLAALGIALAPGGASAADESLEYAVKAAFLYKFGSFVEWPATAFASSTSPFQLCIVGDDPFGAALDKAISGQQIAHRPIEARRLKTVRPDSGCHIAYLAASEAQRLAQTVEALRGSSVLTVTDNRPPGVPAGIVNFVIRDDRVRFDIDDEAAALNRLAISSKLLSVALSVKPRRVGEGR